MKRSSSAPCLADEGNTGSKKAKEESEEPTGREYLQLALARVLELQRQVKDDTYATDNTSDLGESDSEEDVMKEVLIKVFKDLPGSSPAVTSIINRATRSQPPQIREIRDKRVQLSGYDTCRRVAIEFMNTVVKNTPTTDYDYDQRFEMGTFSRIETKIASHKTGLTAGQSSGDKSKSNSIVFPNDFQGSVNGDKTGKTRSAVEDCSRSYTSSSRILPRGGGFAKFDKLQNACYKKSGNNSNQFPRCQIPGLLTAEENTKNINRGIDRYFENGENRRNSSQEVRNPSRSLLNLTRNEREPTLSRDYEIRVRMLKGLDLHLATKQRDFTARLMRQ